MAAGPTTADELVGRVVNEHGDPLPDALVTIPAATVAMPEIALRVDEDGRFRLRLPDGRFTLRAHTRAGTGEVEVERPGDDEVVIAVG